MVRVSTVLLLLFSITLSAQAQKDVQNYISQYKDIAIREMERYGIPASIKMGQGILESAAGTSELSLQARNHFGIKCKKDWAGETYTYDDDAKGECFRKYATVFDSYEDHSRFLKNNARYAGLFELDPRDYKAWAHGLKKAGYATNPQYAQLLIKAIEDYRLYELDTAPGDSRLVEEAKPVKKEERGQDQRPDLEDFTTGVRDKHDVKLRNRVKYMITKEGDTYEKIIHEFSLMSWELYSYNDLSRSTPLKAGTELYLQPKRRKAEVSSHSVRQGETLRDISQMYAVRIQRIRKINKLGADEEPKAGQVLRLR